MHASEVRRRPTLGWTFVWRAGITDIVNIPVITIIVPTINRSAFVLRLLRYYADSRFSGCILIGDSSDNEHAARIRAAIQKLSHRLHVTYVDCCGLDDRLTIAKLSHIVTTAYVAYMGDDDLLIPSGLQRCVEFLGAHREYVAANGFAVAVQLSNSGAHGGIASVHAYPQPDIGSGTARGRLQALFASYRVSLFSVHRVEAWRAMWRNAEEVEDRTFGAELLPCSLSAVLGKIKHLDCLYLVRQSHDQTYHLPGFFEWVATPVWFSSFQTFLTRLAAEIATRDGEQVDVVTPWVREQFLWLYLVHHLPVPRQDQYPANRVLRAFVRLIPGGLTFWKVLKEVPGARLAWRTLSAAAHHSSREMSLHRLLRLVAPYGEQFLPVYRAMTENPVSDDCVQ